MRKAVIAGCGSICRDQWVTPLLECPEVQLVGLVDTNSEVAHKLRADFSLGRIPVGTELSAVIDQTGADTVFDCTVPSAHKEIVASALLHGCDVLGEKPMAETVGDARELIELADTARSGGAPLLRFNVTACVQGFISKSRYPAM